MRAVALTEDTKALELSLRAIKCRYWRWAPGMVDTFGRLNTEIGWFRPMRAHDQAQIPPLAARLPDLDHPATLGCLMALVREVWKAERLYSSWFLDAQRWEVLTVPDGQNSGFTELIGHGPTEAASWVSALENR